MNIHFASLSGTPGPRGKHDGACQTKLFITPDGCNGFLDFAANSTTAPNRSPVRLPFDRESTECIVDGGDNAFKLFKSMTGGNGESEAFLAASDGGKVNGLDIYAMFLKEIVGCLSGLDSITD
jgi:hypothetical protein